jgi:hypothetical protein
MEGPTKAPRANVDVQSPEINPYVSKLFGKPHDLKCVELPFIHDQVFWSGKEVVMT